MILQFLGTGAAEGNPSPFCNCKNCTYVRKKRGRNVRRQASALIDDDLLIDFGPDVTRVCNDLGIAMANISSVLVTHCHFDHLYGGNIYHRVIGPRTTPLKPLRLYGPSRIADVLRDWWTNPKEQCVTVQTLTPYEQVRIGKYQVQTFAITQNDPFAGVGLCYAVRNHGKTLLYAVDTYRFPEKNWQAMRGLVFDVVILDETFGYDDSPNKDHHNIPLFLETMRRFTDHRLVHNGTRFYAQHLSHHNPPHDLLVRILAKHHVIVPYDGMRIVC